MQRIFRDLVVTAFLVLAINPRAQAQMAGTLDLQTHCESALAGIRMEGDMFQLPVAGGDAYQCFGFVAAIQQLSGVYIQAEGRSLTNLSLPADSSLVQLVRVVVAHGQKHPEKLNERNPAVFVINALAEAFPCN